jgi:multiple sugar transport system permease protein
MKKMSAIKKRNLMEGWLSIIPVIIVILFIKGYPLVMGFIKSFTDWNGIGSGEWIGLENYIEILSSSEFWLLLKNNLIFLCFIPILLLVGVVVAVLLYEEVFGWKFFRSVYYLPQIISAVIVGYMFAVFFSYDGPINMVLRAIGLESLALDWLGSGLTGTMVILFCLIWINVGWQALLVLGGLSSIQPSIFEAAKIDGAGYWRRLFSITFPLLGRTIEYSCVMNVIWVMTGLFPYIYTMTQGGPGYETTTIDYMIYNKSFGISSELGYASALSFILLILVLLFTVAQMKFSNKMNEWGD